MRNSKLKFTSKILAVVLSMCMVFGMMPVVFAANPIVTVGTATGIPGETVSIPVTLSDPSDIAGYVLTITYDPSKIIAKQVIFSSNQPAGLNDVNWNAAAQGSIRLTYAAFNPLTEGLIFTVNFEIKEGASAGEVAVEITQERFDNVNDGSRVPVTVVQGKVNVKEDPVKLAEAKAAFKAVTAKVPQALQDAQQALDNAVDVPNVTPAKTAVQQAIAAVQAANKTDAQIDALTTVAEVNAAKDALEAALDNLKTKVDELNEVMSTVGDLNNDGRISVGDLGILAYYYGKDSNSPEWNVAYKYDFNNDGRIGLEDLVFIAIRIIG